MLAFQHARLRSTSHPIAELDAKRGMTALGNSISHNSSGILGNSGSMVAPAVLPTAKVWISIDQDNSHYHEGSGEHHRYMLGEEALTLQGWPIMSPIFAGIKAKRSNLFFQDIAGNAFPCTVISSILIAIIFALDPKEITDDHCVTDADMVNDAIAMFSSSSKAAS
jgi:hypothetical protein